MRFSAHGGMLAEIPTRTARMAKALDTDQLKAHRNEEWRRAHDEGTPHPLYPGRLVRRSVAFLAQLWRVEESTVRRGIASARDVREELDRESA